MLTFFKAEINKKTIDKEIQMEYSNKSCEND